MTDRVYAGGQAQNSEHSVALLIDGENISHDYAGKLIATAKRSGELIIKRTYGSVSGIPNWDAAPGFRFIHSGCGKNSADILLTIDALDISWTQTIDTFVIASSDGDFSHLAHHLRERGFGVVGVGEKKAPDSFRKACSTFIELSELKKTQVVKLIPLEPLDRKIREVLNAAEKTGGLEIQDLGHQMYKQHGVKISTHDKKTWRSYLSSKPELYSCDPRGPDARVRVA